MAGSHRNVEQVRHRILTHLPHIAIAVGVIAIIAFVVWTVADDPESGLPSATQSASPTPTPAPASPTASAPSDSLPQIPPAAPKRLVIEGLVDAGFDESIEMEDEQVEARSADDLSRIGSRGEPGSPGEDTVIIVGQDRFDQQAALNDIADVKKGDRVRLTTANARLTYRVQSTFRVASGTLASASLFTDERPGRLILVATTYSEAGDRTGADTVVVATLARAKAL